MSAEPKRPHSRIRTFAQDLEEQRQKRGQSTPASSEDTSGEAESASPEEVKPKRKPEPAPQAQAAADLPEVPKIPDEPTKSAPKKAVPAPVPKAQAASDTKAIKREPVAAPKVVIPKPAKPSTSTPPAKIPAFHELQKQVENLSKEQDFGEPPKNKPAPHPTKNNRPAADEAPLRGVNIGYDATVITDTKHKRFRLIPSAIASIKRWFKDLTKKRKKAAPKYSVPEADRRKGVIQKATSKSGSVFTADNDTLREQIRRRRHESEEARRRAEAEARAKAEAKQETEPETSWSPYTETGFPLLEDGDDEVRVLDTTPKNVTIEFKKQTPLQTAPPATEPPASDENALVTPDTEQGSEPVPEPEPAPEPMPVAPEPEPEPVPQASVATEPTPEPVPPAEPEPEPVPEPEPPQVFEPIDEPVQNVRTSDSFEESEPQPIDWRDTNTLTMAIFGVVVVLAIAGLLVLSLMRQSQPVTPVAAPFQTQFLAGAQTERVDYAPGENLTELIIAKSDELPLGLIDVQIHGTDGEVLPPGVIIDGLGFTLIPSFRQSVTDVRFSTINQSDPILIFDLNDAVSARGGFLAWERTMASDLVELYRISTNSSLSFTDDTVQGVDVRVMRTREGETLIVYGIVDENTALIGNSIEDFSQILRTSFAQ